MNWGHKLLIAFTAFGAMMIFMVVRSFGTKFDMVEKEYYKSELSYQKVIDATRNANKLSSSVAISKNGDELTIQMPAELQHETSTGTIWFYNAADAARDMHVDLKTDETGSQKINAALLPGNYTVKIQWNAGNTNYYNEQQLSIQ